MSAKPAAAHGDIVRAAAAEAGDPTTVEVIGLVSMSAPVSGEPTGFDGSIRRRTHIRVPEPIPGMLDLAGFIRR